MNKIWLVPSKNSLDNGQTSNINKPTWKMYYNKSRLKIQIWTQNRQLPTQFGELRKFEILWWSGMNTKHCFVFILSFVLPSYSISVHLNWVIGELVTIIGSTSMSHFQKELCDSLVLKCKMEKFFLFVCFWCLFVSFIFKLLYSLSFLSLTW